MIIESHQIQIPFVPCQKCGGTAFNIDSINLRKYVFSEPIICSQCKTEQDWWTLLLSHIEMSIPIYLFAMVGAISTMMVIKMKPNETVSINLSEVQIPEDASILYINYSPNGKGVFPLEIHGNTPIRHFIPHTIRLYGMPSGESTIAVPIAILTMWVQTTFTEEAWQSLVQAFEAYSYGKFLSVIIPANVSVESRLSKLLNDYMCKFASKERVGELLESRATYSYQLNVLLPMLTHCVKFPELPEHIRGFLNKLRDMRNDLAHKGKLDFILDKTLCSKLLCASLFGFGYIELLEDHLRRAA